MPQPYEFDLLHADGIRHADLDAGVRVLNELIFECQQSLEGLSTRGWTWRQGHGAERLASHGTVDAVSGLLRPPLT